MKPQNCAGGVDREGCNATRRGACSCVWWTVLHHSGPLLCLFLYGRFGRVVYILEYCDMELAFTARPRRTVVGVQLQQGLVMLPGSQISV